MHHVASYTSTPLFPSILTVIGYELIPNNYWQQAIP